MTYGLSKQMTRCVSLLNWTQHRCSQIFTDKKKNLLKEGLADGGKGVAVLGTGAALGNGHAVLLGAISFVLGEAVVGKLAV